MAFGQVTAKVVLTVINLVFSVIAIVLVMIGAWLFSYYYDYDHVATDNSTLIPACIVTGVGIFLLLAGILGFVVTFKDSKCLAGMFLLVMVLLLVGLVVGSVLAYVFRDYIDKAVDDGLKKALNEYDTDEVVHKEIDFMQSELKCCGIHNYTDWLYLEHNITYPNSCCVNKNCTYENPDVNLYKEGCYCKMKRAFIHYLTVVGSVAAGCAGLLLLGIVCSVILLSRRSQDVGYIGLPESDGLHV